jgi:hypothetical protein
VLAVVWEETPDLVYAETAKEPASAIWEKLS